MTRDLTNRARLAGSLAAAAVTGLLAAAGAASDEASEPPEADPVEARRTAPAGPGATWEAVLAPEAGTDVSGHAALVRVPGATAEAPPTWELRLALAPSDGIQATSTYLRRGSCAEPGRVIAKAQPDLNVQGERSTIRIPEHALPSAWIGPHPAGEPLPPTDATDGLAVDVQRRDGRHVACGALRPAADVAAP